MTKEQLLTKLRAIATDAPPDNEDQNHRDADRLLLAYIGDPEVTAAFDMIEKWYA